MPRSLPPDASGPSRREFLTGILVLTAGGAALVGCSSDATSGAKGSSSSATETATAAGVTAQHGGPQWPVYGHDLAQTRTNITERRITADNVAGLAKVWEIPDLVGVTGTPAVVDGIAYFVDWKGQAWAVQADTGEKVWTTPLGGMFVAAPAVEGDGVFVAEGSSLYRLDRATGKQVWKATTNDHPEAQISASPVVVDGIVLQGTASFENVIRKEKYQFRGSIGGYDAKTGKQRWNFFATPGDETGGPGAGIWSTPAVDTERGMLYVGTGQALAEPTPPMANSLVALDYRTGKKAWSRQFTYPDVFSAGYPHGKDADVGASPNLWSVEGHDLVGAGDKGGTFHALDRDTGKVVWESELTPGSFLGGEIGSAAFVDGMLITSSNVGDPKTNAPTNVTHLFGIDPATGKQRWKSDALTGKIFSPVGAVPGVAFCGTDQGRLLAFAPATGATLWSMDAPAKTACGPSIVDGRVLWGYGFIFSGAPGLGGILALEVPK